MTPEREAALRAWFDGTADDLPYTGPHLEATRRGRRVNPDDAWQDECRDLLAHVDHLRTWPGLMETVRSHFPEDVFDGSSGDPGPLLVVALREIDRLKGEHNADLACLVATRDAVISAGDRDLAAAIVAARVKGDAVVAALDAERKAHAETRVGVIEIVKVARDEIEAWTSGMAAEKARADALEAKLAEEHHLHSYTTARLENERKCHAEAVAQARHDAEAKLAALVECAGWAAIEATDVVGLGCQKEGRETLRACLSDLSTAAQAYRDRVRAEALTEAADGFADLVWCVDCGLVRANDPEHDEEHVTRDADADDLAQHLRHMAIEKGGAR
jgi:hypothetical protein